MSKNVAVFVDVANIFYAAKAAGVDIDYVTLLRAATAGRDLVRAYAYTGLDPENENQRQFHAFLARSGYKVVSKDIRKYGDGRVKANLDIELVVDMMRMADKIDIAVVVSGDGDFAPAIHAIQQQGVRVEVISFRGNTSSDLIEAADVFIDIADVAKVEKGARSGRRVAAEGDLSMTEVPDKESGVVPRRRRTRGEDEAGARRTERRRRTVREPQAAEPGPAPVALPGERLARGVPGPEPEVAEMPAAVANGGDDAEEAGGRRRRRRRGGRGRGRGGRVDEMAPAAVDTDVEAVAPGHLDEIPTLPQHSGFGSVWDSQIGMPAETSSVGPVDDDDEADYEAEPEVPEYLLAERRQQGRRRGGRSRGPGRQGGYRSALDRERYGVGGPSGYSRGSNRGAGQAGRPAPQRPPSTPVPATPEARAGGDPWSEVPPDVQELLRAELARRTNAPPDRAATPAAASSAAESAATTDGEPAAEAKPKRATRRTSASPAAATDGEPAAEAKPKRATRRTSARTAPETESVAATDEQGAEEPKPKRATRRTSARTAAATDEQSAEEPKPKRATRRTSASASEAPPAEG